MITRMMIIQNKIITKIMKIIIARLIMVTTIMIIYMIRMIMMLMRDDSNDNDNRNNCNDDYNNVHETDNDIYQQTMVLELFHMTMIIMLKIILGIMILIMIMALLMIIITSHTYIPPASRKGRDQIRRQGSNPLMNDPVAPRIPPCEGRGEKVAYHDFFPSRKNSLFIGYSIRWKELVVCLTIVCCRKN